MATDIYDIVGVMRVRYLWWRGQRALAEGAVCRSHTACQVPVRPWLCARAPGCVQCSADHATRRSLGQPHGSGDATSFIWEHWSGNGTGVGGGM